MHSTSNLDDGYIGSGQILWHSIRKYGRENFIREIKEFLPDRKTLGLREKEIISKELMTDPLCMNLKLGREYSPGTYGKKYSEESRKKMSEWKRSDEMKKRISQSHLGLCPSLETRQKMSNSAKKRKVNGMSGKTQSHETRQKISAKKRLRKETK